MANRNDDLEDLFIPGKGWVQVDQDGMIHTPDDIMDEIFGRLEDLTNKPNPLVDITEFIHEAPKRLQ